VRTPEPEPAPALEPVVRLERDAITRAGYAVFGSWAWFLYGFGALLPLLRAEQGTNRTVMGLHSLALAAGALVAGVTAVAVVRRWRRRGGLLGGAGLVVAGALLLCVGRVPAVTLAGVLVMGIGGATMLNTLNPTLTEHHGPAGAAALAEGNAVAAGVGLVAPLAVGAGVAVGIGWRPAVLGVIPLLLLLVVLVRRIPRGTPALDEVVPPPRSERTVLPGAFWLVWLVVILAVGIEFAMTAWSADLLRQRTGLSPAAASAGVTAIVGGMAVGRVAMGRLALRFPTPRLLVGAFSLTVVGWAIGWLSVAPGPALAGLAVTGLGIAGLYPLGLALLFDEVPGRQDQAAGVLSFGIGLASGLIPFALGALADATDTWTAFVVVPGLAGTALALLALRRRRLNRAARVSG
jgi:fucose permease